MVGSAPRADRLFWLFLKTNMGNNMFETTLSIEFKNVPHRILISKSARSVIALGSRVRSASSRPYGLQTPYRAVTTDFPVGQKHRAENLSDARQTGRLWQSTFRHILRGTSANPTISGAVGHRALPGFVGWQVGRRVPTPPRLFAA